MDAHETLTTAAKKRTPLRDLDLRGAKLRGAQLVGLRGDFLKLDGADLAGADLDAAHLMDCDLQRADITGATFGGATLWQCKLDDARGDGAKLHGLRGGSVWLARASLVGATFARAELDRSVFDGALLDRAVFGEARADDASFVGASAAGAYFVGASLKRAVFRDADLRDADLTLADLSEADLRGAKFERASFAGAKLDGALFDGSLPDTTGAPPSANPLYALRVYLKAGDVARVRAAWSSWPPHYARTFVCDVAGEKGGDLAARAALFDMLLDDPDDWVRFCATCALANAGDVEVPRVIDRMAACLDAKPFAPPKHPGIGPGKRDLGLAAAVALAHRDAPEAQGVLELGLAAKKADVRQRCANALAHRAVVRGETHALKALAHHGDARVRAGATNAALRFLERTNREGPPSTSDPMLVRVAIAIVTDAMSDASPAVQRFAKVRPPDLLRWLASRFADS